MMKTIEQIKTSTDEVLMSFVAQGEKAPFEELYIRYAQRLQGFFLRMLGYDNAKAQDFTQELFLKVYEQRFQFKKDKCFSSWLFTIAYNLCKNDYRHTEIVQSYEAEQTCPNIEPIVEPNCFYDRILLEQCLHTALTNLPEEQRIAFTLRYQEELAVKEIAQILACPEGTVKSRLYYALQSISKAMKEFKES